MPRRTKKEESITAPKRITSDWLKDFDMSHITDLTKTEAERVLRSGIYQVNKRRKEFNKYGITSPAFQAYYGKDAQKGKIKTPKDATVQQLWHEVEKAMMLIRSKTGNIKGAIDYWANEEKRILDDDAKRMTERQRERYWAAYMEFMKETNYKYYRDGSERIQQYLGQMTFWRKKKFSQEDIDKLITFAESGKPPAPETEDYVDNVSFID